jgi:tRNA(Ile)-lysidine synthase
MAAARRSHPPTLITLASRTLREECGVGRGARLLCAVSGGPDSMALLDVLAHLAPKFGYELVAHGVDHGLRAEARAELDLAERHARALGVVFERTHVSVAPGGNLQARARTARYAALEHAARRAGAGLIATAHHADDRAETVLLRLLRGSGPRGLAVLPARTENRLRPLLRARRSDILLHLARHRVPFAQDPSNRDRRHLRVRVREELMPLLVELSPGIVAHLNALADALVGTEDAATFAGVAALGLGRAHRRQLARALALSQRGSAIWLPGGAVLALDGATLEPRLAAHARGKSPRPAAPRSERPPKTPD